MIRHSHPAWAAAWLLAVSAARAVDAPAPLRDPMQAPAVAQSAARRDNSDGVSAPAQIVPRHLMTIDGRRYLIDRGRRLGVGDMLGGARIERIDDAAVWLREAGELRQFSLFGGIAKRAVPMAPESNPLNR